MAGGEEFPGVMAPSRARAVLSLHSGVLGEIEVKFSHCNSKRRQRSLAKYKEHSDITCQIIYHDGGPVMTTRFPSIRARFCEHVHSLVNRSLNSN